MLDVLFRNNYFFLYLFFCVTVFNYSEFFDNQKLILIYLTTCGLSVFSIMSSFDCMIFSAAMTFMYLEFFTKDNSKLKYINKMKFKICDYILIMIVQYGFVCFLISLLFTNKSFLNYLAALDVFKKLTISKKMAFLGARFIFLIPLFISIMATSSLKFEILTVDELLKKFNPKIYNINFSEDLDSFFNILISIEDQSFFKRKNSYSFFSYEFLRYKMKSIAFARFKKSPIRTMMAFAKSNKIIRGYSTIEMQLIRAIGLKNGYRMKYRRKFFELVYTSIFFKSLKKFYEQKSYANHWDFKKYLLLIYIFSVNTQICKKYYPTMNLYFVKEPCNNKYNPKNWDKEKFFIACEGLSHKRIDENNILKFHPEIIKRHGLCEKKITELIRDEC